jgi:hypothetical protein
MSAAWDQSVSATTGSDDGKAEGEHGGENNEIIKKYFGDELLFMAHEFQAQRHMKPYSFLELFEFLKYTKVKGIFKETAIAAAKVGVPK